MTVRGHSIPKWTSYVSGFYFSFHLISTSSSYTIPWLKMHGGLCRIHLLKEVILYSLHVISVLHLCSVYLVRNYSLSLCLFPLCILINYTCLIRDSMPLHEDWLYVCVSFMNIVVSIFKIVTSYCRTHLAVLCCIYSKPLG